MHVTRAQIHGFGCLRGNDWRFGGGVNVVVGPNEAGKSTLQEAILAGLYGLPNQRYSGRQGLLDAAERWRPWQEGPFALALELELTDGTRLRIERDLDAATVRVVSLDTGDDITERFDRDSGGIPEVGRQAMGITREIFIMAACVSRAEILKVEDPGAVKEALAALADSAQPERTAQRVLDRLRGERVDKVGRPRGRTGPLQELAARLAELERQLVAARQARAAVDELAQKREAIAALTEAELSVVATLEAAVLAGRLDQVRRRLDGVRQLERTIEDERARQDQHARLAGFPREHDPDVRRLRTHLRAALEAEQDFQRRAGDVQAEVRRLEQEKQALAAEASAQATLARGIDEKTLKQEPLVRELVSSLTFADAQAPEAHLRAHTCAEELHRIAEQHPGLIGADQDWIARRIEFQRAYSEWQERSNAATEARRRAGAGLPPRLEQLKQDISRYREVPEVISTAQNAEETMRREEALAERARARWRTFGVLLLGSVLLTALAFLVAFVGLSAGLTLFIGSAFLLGMGVLGAIVAILMRGAATREVDRRLKAKDAARLRRREVLNPWGVRNSGELQQALVDHLQRVRHDATRLELDRQAGELEDKALASARALRELVGGWGLPHPAPTAEAVGETARLMETLAEATAAWNAAHERWEESSRVEASLDQRRDALRQRLHTVLDRLGFDRREALAAGNEFLAACESARRVEQLRSRMEQLDAQLEKLRHPAERGRQERQRAEDYARQLEAIYAPSGITDPDLEVAARAWDDAMSQADAYQAASARLAELEAQRRTVAGEQETPALERLSEELRQQLEAALAGVDRQSAMEYQNVPLAELERQRDQHRATKERAQEDRARAEELLNDRLRQLGDVASLEEDIFSAREQLHALEALAQTYDLAIETLEKASRSVRKAVIPQLKSHLQGHLAPITNGRYRDVKVADDLGLQVRASDQRTYKDVDTLSLGTRSLIYVLQRVAIARIISGSAEPLPLLLDEALVHSDRRRVKAALDELALLGKEHQIILFSKDEMLAERGERAGNWTIIRLPGPAVVVPAHEVVESSTSAPNGEEPVAPEHDAVTTEP